jgi:shikimate kinase
VTGAHLLYLVGFMGAGKSAVGRLLAKQLGWTFVDLDKQIERGEKKPIPQIFSESGEPRFRELERAYLRKASERYHAVIALGGGAFMDAGSRELSERTGLTIWLKVSFATVVTRLRMVGSRPMFGNREQAEALFKSREAVYRTARIHVDTDNRPPAAVADEIVEVMRKL